MTVAYAQKLDEAPKDERNLWRLRIWAFYVASAFLVYLTLSRAVYVPQLAGR
jgi:hypothetical protein